MKSCILLLACVGFAAAAPMEDEVRKGSTDYLFIRARFFRSPFSTWQNLDLASMNVELSKSCF